MASYNKFNAFVEHLAGGVHDLFGTGGAVDDIRVYLSNTAPSATGDAVKADLAEIANGGGYSTGGESVTPEGARSGGTFTLGGAQVQWTAVTGGIAQFRYVPCFNSTPSSPADPLIGWWDYGSAITPAAGESFTWKPSNAATGAILTIT